MVFLVFELKQTENFLCKKTHSAVQNVPTLFWQFQAAVRLLRETSINLKTNFRMSNYFKTGIEPRDPIDFTHRIPWASPPIGWFVLCELSHWLVRLVHGIPRLRYGSHQLYNYWVITFPEFLGVTVINCVGLVIEKISYYIEPIVDGQ